MLHLVVPVRPPLDTPLKFSSPAFSTPATWCHVFHSHVFHRCYLVPRFPVPHFPLRVFSAPIFKHQNAPNCTDSNLYLHKFPVGNTPGPHNGRAYAHFPSVRASTVPLIQSFRGRCPQLDLQTCNVTLPTAVIFSYMPTFGVIIHNS